MTVIVAVVKHLGKLWFSTYIFTALGQFIVGVRRVGVLLGSITSRCSAKWAHAPLYRVLLEVFLWVPRETFMNQIHNHLHRKLDLIFEQSSNHVKHLTRFSKSLQDYQIKRHSAQGEMQQQPNRLYYILVSIVNHLTSPCFGLSNPGICGRIMNPKIRLSESQRAGCRLKEILFTVNKGTLIRFRTFATICLIKGVRLIRCPLNTGLTVVFLHTTYPSPRASPRPSPTLPWRTYRCTCSEWQWRTRETAGHFIFFCDFHQKCQRWVSLKYSKKSMMYFSHYSEELEQFNQLPMMGPRRAPLWCPSAPRHQSSHTDLRSVVRENGGQGEWRRRREELAKHHWNITTRHYIQGTLNPEPGKC